MKVWCELPKDREREGRLWVTGEDDARLFGPVLCRGEADNANAAKSNNVVEDPTRVGGDHPFGVCRISECVEIRPSAKEFRTYGPWFLRLNPVSGEAWAARQAGRTGIGIHGGAPGPNNSLRATYGCLRLDDESVESIAILIQQETALGRQVFYECIEEGTPCPSRP